MKPIYVGGFFFVVLLVVAVEGRGDTQQTDKEPVGKDAGKKDIKKLQVKLPDKWKDDGVLFGERRFIKGSVIVFGAIYSGKLPTSPEMLAELAKKNEDLFPGRKWVKTMGVGKFDDGVFLVGICKVMGGEYNALGVARTVDGVTVLFMASPVDDAATRKEVLGLIKSAHFADK